MDNSVYEKILSGQAILFTGSGFSFGARNVSGLPLPTGMNLIKVLSDACNMPQINTLKMASTCYIKKHSKDQLINFLKEQLTVVSVADWHINLAKIPWKRVYTVNYDNVFEYAANHSGKIVTSICMSDSIYEYSKDNICIHLNGSIQRLNKRTLNNEFKLTQESYQIDSYQDNPWFKLFRSDIETAELIVIVGYSMQADLDITRLFAIPSIREKILIIDSLEPDEVNTLSLPDYGDYRPVGIENFSKTLTEFSHTYVPSILPASFNSFVYRYRETSDLSDISYKELIDFYTIGTYHDKFLQRSYSGDYFNGYKYLLYRSSLENMRNNFDKYQYYVVTSDLGNGKTIFCKILINELQYGNYHVFEFVKRQNGWRDEVKKICNDYKRVVVVIDDYPSAMDVIYEFQYYSTNNIKFVLTARTAINKVKYRNLLEKTCVTADKIKLLDINLLSSKDVEDLAYLLKSNRILGDIPVPDRQKDIELFIKNVCKSKFCDLLLQIYNSSDIRNRLNQLLSGISNESENLQNIIMFAIMKPVMSLSIDLIEYENLFNINHVYFTTSESAIINELFEVSNNEPIVKSSIVAKNILYNVLPAEMLLNTSKKILISCATRKIYDNLQINLMSHTHYTALMGNKSGMKNVLDFYDSLREYYQNNHFFWEQFALICIHVKEFNTAKYCIKTAYQIVKDDKHFVPFQIDTINGSCILSEILDNPKALTVSEAIEKANEASNYILKNINHVDNDQYRAFKQLSRIVDIYNYYRYEIDTREKSKLDQLIRRVMFAYEDYKKNSLDFSFKKEMDLWQGKLKKCLS